MIPSSSLRSFLFALLIVLVPAGLYAQEDLTEVGWARKMVSAGLVNLSEKIPDIKVDLMYSRKDNFMGTDVYGALEDAYLNPGFAEKLGKAQALLKQELGSKYSLIIYDAARPLSVQRKMWDVVRDTPNRKYVASPARGGGRHNYGLAVDLSIVDTSTGTPLDMGSSVDHFGVTSHIGDEAALVKRGLITPEAKSNRAYLHGLMKRVGLRPIRKEWWHFEEYTSIRSVRKHKLLDF